MAFPKMPIYSSFLISKPSYVVSLIAYVTSPDLTWSIASCISAKLSSMSTSGLNMIHALNPWGIVFVGSTWISLSSQTWHAWFAARTIFELFGRIIMWSAFTFPIADTKSSVLGFIVWPPPTTISALNSLNIASIPLPGATVMIAYFLCSATTSSSSSFSKMLSCCSCIFSIFNFMKRPRRFPILMAVWGSKVWTWTLTRSSSCTQTIEFPIVANSFLKSSSEKCLIPVGVRWRINSVQNPNSSSPPSIFVWALSYEEASFDGAITSPFIADKKPSKIIQSPLPPLSTTPTSARTGKSSGVLRSDSFASSTIFSITLIQSVISSVTV